MRGNRYIAVTLAALIASTPALAFPGEARADGPGKIGGAFQQRFGGEVAATGASDGDSLTWEAATRRWVPAAGGGGVPTSRTISTSGILAGGGDLTTNRTISVAAVSSNLAALSPLNGSSGAPLFRMISSVDLGGISWTGDTRGAGTAQTVWAIQGRNVSTTAPTNGQVYAWNASTSLWTPTTGGGGGSQDIASVLGVGNVVGNSQVIAGSLGSNIQIDQSGSPGLAFQGFSATGTTSPGLIRFSAGGGVDANAGVVSFVAGDSSGLGNAGSLNFTAGNANAGTVDGGPVLFSAGTSAGGVPGRIAFFADANGDEVLQVSGLGSVITNARGSNLAQNATDGALYVPRFATGAPSGTPTSVTGAGALGIGGDHHLYAELTSGSWTQVDGGSTPGLSSVLGVSSASGAHDIAMAAGQVVSWNGDVAISRGTTGQLRIGNGTPGDFTGNLLLRKFECAGISGTDSTATNLIGVGLSADSVDRGAWLAGGQITWSTGSSTADVSLARFAAGVLMVGTGSGGTPNALGELDCATVGLGSGILTRGSGSPESAVTAPVGSLFLRSDGSANTTLYVKESGGGNTGWIAK